ncbi:MAG: metallophosphoesterase [Pirellulaceae bacterium]
MNALLTFLALSGHLALWVAVSNRIGATGWDHRVARRLRKTINLALVGLPLLGLWCYWDRLLQRDWWLGVWPQNFALTCYALPCWAFFGWVVICWSRRRLQLDRSIQARNQSTKVIWLSEGIEQPPVKGSLNRWLSELPGNQVLSVEVNRKQLVVPRCPDGLSGLTITHFSDTHISRRFTREFYEEMFSHVNRLQSEVIAITGDLVDLDPVPAWALELYGHLVAPRGVFFVLGNHDFRQRQLSEFRGALVEHGLFDLGTGSVCQEINEVAVDFSGNECPWSGATPQDRQDSTDSAFSIALTHSPDQFHWAQQQQIDLLLAGHMHGGQICFPVIGPIVAPSRHGVAYSAGCFQQGVTTMHVSRGAGGLAPLRWNCRPEITQLEIRPAT